MTDFSGEREDITAESMTMKGYEGKYYNSRPISLIILEQTNSFKDSWAQLMQEEIIGKWINKLVHSNSRISFSDGKK